jgi:hypothetical protein
MCSTSGFTIWRKQAKGDVIVVRYADDFIVGFQYRYEAQRLLTDLTQRFGRFGLELHPDKTRVLEFGRFAREDRSRRKQGKPETFNFLGFTHICGLTRKGKFTVLRKTMRTRRQAKLKEGHLGDILYPSCQAKSSFITIPTD